MHLSRSRSILSVCLWLGILATEDTEGPLAGLFDESRRKALEKKELPLFDCCGICASPSSMASSFGLIFDALAGEEVAALPDPNFAAAVVPAFAAAVCAAAAFDWDEEDEEENFELMLDRNEDLVGTFSELPRDSAPGRFDLDNCC